MAYVAGKIMTRYGMKRYNILLTGDMKILTDDEETKDKGVTDTLKFINNTAYNDLVLEQ